MPITDGPSRESQAATPIEGATGPTLGEADGRVLRFGPSELSWTDVGLCVALAYFVLIGGTDMGSVTVVKAVNASLGAGFITFWAVHLPKRGDSVDRLILVSLLLYLVACITSTLPHVSFGAATDALAYAAVFSVARWRISRASVSRAAVTTLALCGACLAVVVFGLWGQVVMAWLREAGSFPPLDAPMPVGPFRHRHVVAMMLATMAPAMLAVLSRRRLQLIGATGLILGAAVTLVAGGRGVWAALTAVIAAPLIGRAVWTRRAIVVGVAGAALIAVIGLSAGLGGAVLARLFTTSTLSYRLAVWEEVIGLWLDRPILGLGPGSFGITVTLSGFFDSNPYLPRHADNAVVQALGEGGVVTLLAMAVVISALVIGVRNAGRDSSRLAIAGLALLCLLSVTDNPTDSPNLVVIGILWAALATPRLPASNPTEGARITSPILRGLRAAALLVIGSAVASTIVAAFAFDSARVSAAVGDLATTRSRLAVSTQWDPGMAMYWRDLGIYEHAIGNNSIAERHLERASELNPADTAALRALAVVREALGDDHGAMVAARDAVDRRRWHPINLLTLAAIASRVEDDGTAREALTEVLVFAPWLPASDAWDDATAPQRALPSLLLAAGQMSEGRVSADPNQDFSRVWLRALTNQETATENVALKALDEILRCELDDAKSTMESMPIVVSHSYFGVVDQLLLGQMLGDTELYARGLTIAQLRMSPLADIGRRSFEVDAPWYDVGEDLRLYGTVTIDQPPSQIRLPSRNEALAAWLIDPPRAAMEVAPASLLGGCESKP